MLTIHFKLRALATASLMLVVTAAAAQKDGRPAPAGGIAPPLAKDGIPVTVAISPGTFVMGADAAPLQVVERFRTSQQRLVVILDHLGEELRILGIRRDRHGQLFHRRVFGRWNPNRRSG